MMHGNPSLTRKSDMTTVQRDTLPSKVFAIAAVAYLLVSLAVVALPHACDDRVEMEPLTVHVEPPTPCEHRYDGWLCPSITWPDGGTMLYEPTSRPELLPYGF